jgi:hypothetical protein
MLASCSPGVMESVSRQLEMSMFLDKRTERAYRAIRILAWCREALNNMLGGIRHVQARLR